MPEASSAASARFHVSRRPSARSSTSPASNATSALSVRATAAPAEPAAPTRTSTELSSALAPAHPPLNARMHAKSAAMKWDLPLMSAPDDPGCLNWSCDEKRIYFYPATSQILSLIHISEPTRLLS